MALQPLFSSGVAWLMLTWHKNDMHMHISCNFFFGVEAVNANDDATTAPLEFSDANTYVKNLQTPVNLLQDLLNEILHNAPSKNKNKKEMGEMTRDT